MRARVEAQAHVPIGIDLGTSFSRVAMWKDGDVIVIPNERGRLATPSVVSFAERGVLVGAAAQEQAASNPENTIFAPQRLLGARFENPWVQWYSKTCPLKIVRGENGRARIRVRDRGTDRHLAPEELVTMLLQHLKRMAEKYLGCRATEVVVTVPAQFGHNQRTALVEACKDARLKVLALLKAPTAAAIAFTQTNPTRSRHSIIVCDIGARYFDFSVLTIEDGVLQERAVGTDHVDLEAALVRFCVKDIKQRLFVDIAHLRGPMQRLRDACEMAKRELSQLNAASIEVKGLVSNMDYSVCVSRSHFEDATYQDLESMLEPIDYCLEDCGLGRDEVDVVLVGGSARIPQVRRAIRTFFYGRTPCEVLRPEHAAVLGAGVYVALLSHASRPSRASRHSSCSSHATHESGETVLDSAPEGLHQLRLREMMPWCFVPKSGNANETTANNEGHSNGCDGARGILLSPACEKISSLPTDELEPAPCNEAAGFPNHKTVALRHASCPHRAVSSNGLAASSAGARCDGAQSGMRPKNGLWCS